MVCYKSSCISSGYIVTPFYFASRITPYMLSISWIVIPTSPHSHFGLSEMRIKSVTVHPNSSLGAQEPKNAMNSCLLHPIHHFSEVLWHFSHSNMFYTMKSVLASNADVHILSTIYKHVLKVSRIILQMNQSAFDRLVTFIVPMQFDERSQETQILNA